MAGAVVEVAVAESQELPGPRERVNGPAPVTFKLWGAGGGSFKVWLKVNCVGETAKGEPETAKEMGTERGLFADPGEVMVTVPV